MDALLTVGGVHQLIEAEGLFTDRHHPTLQVIKIRRVPANALTDVYWVSKWKIDRELLHLKFSSGTNSSIATNLIIMCVRTGGLIRWRAKH